MKNSTLIHTKLPFINQNSVTDGKLLYIFILLWLLDFFSTCFMRLTSLSLHIFIKSSPQGHLNLYRMTVKYSVAYGFFFIALQNILIQNERALINLISYVKIHWDEKGLTDIHSYSLRFLRLDVSDQQRQRSLCQNDTQIHVYIGIQSLIFLYRKG